MLEANNLCVFPPKTLTFSGCRSSHVLPLILLCVRHTYILYVSWTDLFISLPMIFCLLFFWSRTPSYLVVVGSTVVVYSAATSEPVGECKHDARVNSACFTGGEGGGAGAAAVAAVATCADDKTIRFFRAEGGTLLVNYASLVYIAIASTSAVLESISVYLFTFVVLSPRMWLLFFFNHFLL